MNDIEMLDAFVFWAKFVAVSVMGYALFKFFGFAAETLDTNVAAVCGGFVALLLIVTLPVLAYRR